MSVDQVLSKLNIQSIPKAKKMWEDSFAELCSRHGFYPGIEEMVKSVHENGLLIYILTSRSHCTADPLCNDSAISSYIDGCVAAEDTTHHKPDPEPVRKVLGITGIKPEEAIYIGDTNQDYQAAKAAGVCFGLAGWNKNTVGVNYDYLLERPEDVLQYI
jgi:HAD superfamily hydrolase (TIGR01549 family)